MPKVLHVVQSGDGGGVQRHVRDLAVGLPQCTAGIVMGSEGWLTRTVRGAEIPVRQAPHMQRTLDPRAVTTARKEFTQACQDLSPDIVHAHGIFALLAALPQAGSKPLVYTGHGFQWHDATHPWGLRRLSLGIHRRAAQRVTAFVAVASEDDEARQIGFKRVERIRNGVPAWDAGTSPADSNTFGVATRLVPGKGLEELLSVLVAEPELRLRIAGDGPLRERLKQEALKGGFADRLELLGWQDDLRGFYSGLRGYVSLSHKEGLPYGALDALAAGLPVVLSDIPGHRELVDEERNGYLVPLGDPAAARSALRRLMKDSDLAAAAGAASKSLAKERFPLDRMLERHVELYEAVGGTGR